MIDLKTWLESAPANPDGQAWREMARALQQRGYDVEIDDTLVPRRALVADLPPLRWGRIARMGGRDGWQGWNARTVCQADGRGVGAVCYGPPDINPLVSICVKDLVTLVQATPLVGEEVPLTLNLQTWLEHPPVDADGQLWRELVSHLLAAGWEVRYLECYPPERRPVDMPSVSLRNTGHVWLLCPFLYSGGVWYSLKRCTQGPGPSFQGGNDIQHMIEQVRTLVSREVTP